MLCRICLLAAFAGLAVTGTPALAQNPGGERSVQSHEPMRPLPTPAKREVAKGPKRFVDAARGDDSAAGTEQAPWKTLNHALRQLQPGDTLYLRGGIYYEKVSLTRSGTEDAPITIGSYPGELAIID